MSGAKEFFEGIGESIGSAAETGKKALIQGYEEVKEFGSALTEKGKSAISNAASGISAHLLAGGIVSQYLGEGMLGPILKAVLGGAPIKSVPEKLAAGLNAVSAKQLGSIFGKVLRLDSKDPREAEDAEAAPEPDWSAIVAKLEKLDSEELIKAIMMELDTDDVDELVKSLEGTIV